MFEYYEVHFKFTPPLYNCTTVDMLFNIVDGNYESWKYVGQKTARDRLAPGKGPSFPHPGVRPVFCAVQIIHIFFSYFIFC